MKTPRQSVWPGVGLLAVLVIAAAAIYFRRGPEPIDLRGSAAMTPIASSVAAPKSEAAASPAPAPARRNVLRGAETVPKINLAETVERLKLETAVDAPPMTAALGSLLSSREEERAEAVGTLGFSEDPRFVAPIVHLLQTDPVPGVRAAAASALELYRGREVAAALALALTDPNEDVRAQALLSLKFQRDSSVERELQVQLKNGELDEVTALEVRLFLDRHYVRKDPFKDPVAP